MEMVLIPAGKFVMGSTLDDWSYYYNTPLREVTITKCFYMGKYAVTQEDWIKVMQCHPPVPILGANLPVTNVSWEDCQGYINTLNEQTEGGYRLPTEAEWEYACRAGTTTEYFYSDNIFPKSANFRESNIVKPVAVGNYKENAFGLYNMHGNIWEWCEDWYGLYDEGYLQTDPKGPETGENKVLRGGSFANGVWSARAAFRHSLTPSWQFVFNGFRLARDCKQ